MEQMRNVLLPQMKTMGGESDNEMMRRLEEALGQSADNPSALLN